LIWVWVLPGIAPRVDDIIVDSDGNIHVSGLVLKFKFNGTVVVGETRLVEGAPRYRVRASMHEDVDMGWQDKPTTAFRAYCAARGIGYNASFNGAQPFSLQTDSLQAVLRERYRGILTLTGLLGSVRPNAVAEVAVREPRHVVQTFEHPSHVHDSGALQLTGHTSAPALSVAPDPYASAGECNPPLGLDDIFDYASSEEE
jgi:hypothetical protein